MSTTTMSRTFSKSIVNGGNGALKISHWPTVASFFDGVQRNSLLAYCNHWCGTTPYAQNINANVNAAAAMASPQVSGAPIGRRRLYSTTAPVPAIATRKDITNATTRVDATS